MKATWCKSTTTSMLSLNLAKHSDSKYLPIFQPTVLMKLLRSQFPTLPVFSHLACWAALLSVGLPTIVYGSDSKESETIPFNSYRTGSPNSDKSSYPIPVSNADASQPLLLVAAGDIWLEAEEANAIGAFWTSMNDPDASGGAIFRLYHPPRLNRALPETTRPAK